MNFPVSNNCFITFTDVYNFWYHNNTTVNFIHQSSKKYDNSNKKSLIISLIHFRIVVMQLWLHWSNAKLTILISSASSPLIKNNVNHWLQSSSICIILWTTSNFECFIIQFLSDEALLGGSLKSSFVMLYWKQALPSSFL